MSQSLNSSANDSGGFKVFTGESEDYKEYKRWKLWISNKIRTLDKLESKNYGSYVFTCLGGKALEAIEHLEPAEYQKEGGDLVILRLLDKRVPEKEKTDEMAEILGEIFSLRAKEGESPLSFSTDVSAKLASSFHPKHRGGWSFAGVALVMNSRLWSRAVPLVT